MEACPSGNTWQRIQYSPYRPDRLHKRSLTLFDSKMSVDGGVPCSSSEVLALLILDMLPISLDVSLGQPKIKDEYLMRGLVQPHAEVIRFDIAMNEVPIMDILNP